MPQLTPEPWFSIFLCTWTTLIMSMSPKILDMEYLNDLPPPKPINKIHPWNWPW